MISLLPWKVSEEGKVLASNKLFPDREGENSFYWIASVASKENAQYMVEASNILPEIVKQMEVIDNLPITDETRGIREIMKKVKEIVDKAGLKTE